MLLRSDGLTLAAAPAPPDLLDQVRATALVAAGMGACGFLLLAWMTWRTRGRTHLVPIEATRVVSGVVAVLLTSSLGVITATLALSWASWRWAQVAAVAGVVGAFCLLGAVVSSVASRRLAAPLGLWRVTPFLGPRIQVDVVPPWLLEHYPTEDRWAASLAPPSATGTDPWVADPDGWRTPDAGPNSGASTRD